MSTFGVVVIADLASVEEGQRLVEQVTAVLAATDPTYANSVDWVSESGPLGVRVSIDVPGAVTEGNEDAFFAGLGSGRGVVCVDGDEFGVMFSVWDLGDAGPRCVYLSHLNDPDVDDDGTDSGVAGRIATGAVAVAEVAGLYGVDGAPLAAVEADPTVVTDNLGIIGTPFDPWLDALNLQWPEP